METATSRRCLLKMRTRRGGPKNLEGHHIDGKLLYVAAELDCPLRASDDFVSVVNLAYRRILLTSSLFFGHALRRLVLMACWRADPFSLRTFALSHLQLAFCVRRASIACFFTIQTFRAFTLSTSRDREIRIKLFRNNGQGWRTKPVSYSVCLSRRLLVFCRSCSS